MCAVERLTIVQHYQWARDVYVFVFALFNHNIVQTQIIIQKLFIEQDFNYKRRKKNEDDYLLQTTTILTHFVRFCLLQIGFNICIRELMYFTTGNCLLFSQIVRCLIFTVRLIFDQSRVCIHTYIASYSGPIPEPRPILSLSLSLLFCMRFSFIHSFFRNSFHVFLKLEMNVVPSNVNDYERAWCNGCVCITKLCTVYLNKFLVFVFPLIIFNSLILFIQMCTKRTTHTIVVE